jgi:hypothetical protein
VNASPVARLVRGWVDLYTRGVPAGLRAARRDEIDDDLWCQQEEATAMGRSPRSLAAEVVLRLLFGMPADVSWRLAHPGSRGVAPMERSSSVSIRLFGALAFIAGASWGTMAIIVVVSGLDEWTGPLTVLGLAGGLGLSVTAIGLSWRFQDQLSPIGSVGGLLGGLGILLSTLGAYAAGVLLPIGSAALAWDLGRAGVLPRWVSIVHALSAAAFLAPIIGSLIDYEATFRSDLLVALVIPYILTWMAIGASLLRGVPRAHEQAAGT